MRKKLITLPRLIILGIIVMIIIIGVWLALRAALVKGMTTGIATMETQGYQIGHGGLSVTGFPFTLNATTDKLSIRAPLSQDLDPSKNWSLGAAQLRLKSATLTPLSWSLNHRGNMRVDLRAQSGERYMFDIDPANIDARLAVTVGGKLKFAEIKTDRIQLNPLLGTPPPLLSAEGLSARFKRSGKTGNVRIRGRDLVISELALGNMNDILGRNLSAAELDLRIENWADLERKSSDIWMQNGGRLTSEHWALSWGQLDFIGDFDIGFKDGLPEGVIHVRIKNTAALLDTLIERELVPKAFTNQARKLVASLKTGDDDRNPLEFSIRNGQINYGFIPLYKF